MRGIEGEESFYDLNIQAIISLQAFAFDGFFVPKLSYLQEFFGLVLFLFRFLDFNL